MHPQRKFESLKAAIELFARLLLTDEHLVVVLGRSLLVRFMDYRSRKYQAETSLTCI